MTHRTSFLAIASVALFVASGCDTGNTSAQQTPAAPRSELSTRPATAPATQGVRVPAFSVDGLYFSPTHTLRAVTGDEKQIAGLIDLHLKELSRHYKGPDWRAEAMKLLAAERKKLTGACVLLEGPKDEQKGRLYFIGNREPVHLNDWFVQKASTAAGRPVTFDPMTRIAWYSYAVLESSTKDDDDETSDAKKPVEYSYLALMTAGGVSQALRVGDAFSAPKVASLLFEDATATVLFDKVTLANLPVTKPGK